VIAAKFNDFAGSLICRPLILPFFDFVGLNGKQLVSGALGKFS
jgi:hypothetical protein